MNHVHEVGSPKQNCYYISTLHFVCRSDGRLAAANEKIEKAAGKIVLINSVYDDNKILTAITCASQDFGTYISATVIHANSIFFFICIILLKFVLLASYQR